MARTIADISADITRLEEMIRDHSVKHAPLFEVAHAELVDLIITRQDRMDKRAERRAERHAEIDGSDATLAVIKRERDVSPYLKRQIDLWEKELGALRGEIDV